MAPILASITSYLQSNPLLGTLLLLSWAAMAVYVGSAVWWLLEVAYLRRGWHPAPDRDAFPWGLDDVQVRILTIDSAAVTQATVDSLPDAITDVRVIAESEVSIDGASVHVVPAGFTCAATNKGRAIEWARLNVPCDHEYVLYLDEDTLVTSLTGLPDADVVQFTEKPIYTGSWLTYLCEVFRIGYQFEQFGFHRLEYPLYAWGGGVAVRHRIEQTVTWDTATVTEDTNFIWRAAANRDIGFQVVDARFRNQAPPSVKSMIRQRRRWISGTMEGDDILPLSYRPLYFTRVVAWAFSPFVPLLMGAVYLLPGTPPSVTLYEVLSTGFLLVLCATTALGVMAYRKHPVLWPVFLLLTPLSVLLHSIGALWGVVSPVETFEVTEKVTPERVERVHGELEEGAIAAHDGTGRLVRESRADFHGTAFNENL